VELLTEAVFFTSAISRSPAFVRSCDRSTLRKESRKTLTHGKGYGSGAVWRCFAANFPACVLLYGDTVVTAESLVGLISNMAARVPRHVAMDLIKYVKSLKVLGYAFDVKHRAAYEFAKQLNSPKLAQSNPNFSVSFDYLTEPGTSSIVAEFSNGKKWETQAEGKTCADLRFEFFEQAALAEEDVGDVDDTPAKPAAGGKKK
jgi:hypothetical protein